MIAPAPRILLLANAGSIHTIRLANALVLRGWDVHLASQDGFAEALDPAITRHVAPHAGTLGYFINARWLRRLASDVRPDVCNAHYLSGYGTLARRASLRPLVQTGWGSDVYLFPHKGPINRWLVRKNLLAADHVTVASDDMRRATLALADVPCAAIPFGVDTTVFQPAPVDPASLMPFRQGDFILGIFKALLPIYGHAALIRALGRVRHAAPDLPVRLVIGGDGPERAGLEALVADLGLTGSVHFAGPIAHEAMPRWHNALSAYVVTSVNESLCVSALEAGACGKPVIAYDVGALSEVLAGGETGLLVPYGDEAALAEAILRLARDPALAARLGAAGLARVDAHYAWDKALDALEAVYRGVMKG